MAHQPEGAMSVMGRRLGQSLVGGNPRSKLWKFKSLRGCPPISRCGESQCWHSSEAQPPAASTGLIRKEKWNWPGSLESAE